jgi:hypothetical protein
MFDSVAALLPPLVTQQNAMSNNGSSPAAKPAQANRTTAKRSSGIDEKRYQFAKPMRDKSPAVSWKTITELWTKESGEDVDDAAMKQSFYRVQRKACNA